MCTEDDAFLFKSGRFMHGFVVLPPIVTPPDPLAPDCRLAKEGEQKKNPEKSPDCVFSLEQSAISELLQARVIS